MSIEFEKYKRHLKEYLRVSGYNVKHNPMRCINPYHKDSTPSMLIYDDYFKCQSCGIKGDIYDAVNYIKGISKQIDQYREIDRMFGNGDYSLPEEKKNFMVDIESENNLRIYLRNQSNKNKERITEYFKRRECNQDMIDYFSSLGLGYWTGFEQAGKELSYKMLKMAGIPQKNPETNKSSWNSPGVVLKIGKGFKLFYYDDTEISVKKQSKKMGSKECCTFPFPCLPDNDDIILVEGEMSALSMFFMGFKNTVAIGGVSSLSNDGVRALLKYRKVFIAFDGDKAGRDGKDDLIERLVFCGYDGLICPVDLPDGYDPDDMVKKGKRDELKRIIKESEVKAKEAKEEKDRKEQEAVKEQEAINRANNNENSQPDKKKMPFYFVGYDENSYYVMPTNQRIPIKIGRGDTNIRNMMYDIAPEDWWIENFTKEKEMPDGQWIVTVNISKAVAWFRSEAQKKGWYDMNNEKGVGAHIDGDDIVLNTGRNLYSQDQKKYLEYSEYEGKNLYTRSRIFFDVKGKSWSISDTHALFREICQYGFARNVDYMLLMGFIVLAPFASLLHRRPHIAVMGQRGTGKTTLINNIVKPAIGSTGIFVEGKQSSEAGIRQAIGRDCRSGTFDEFEAHTHEDFQKLKSILGLMRSAYGGDSTTIKGSQNQRSPIIFETRSMFLLAAINIHLDNDGDRSRIPVLKMKRSTNKIGKTFDFSGLRKRTFDTFKRTLDNIELAKEYIKSNCDLDDRAADTYGALIGGFWSAISECDFLGSSDPAINQSVIDALSQVKIEVDEVQRDEELLLDNILNYKVRIDPGTEKTISEMLVSVDSQGKLTYDNNLRQIGIRRDFRLKMDGYDLNSLSISVNSIYISDMLKSTPFSKYKNILIRHPASLYEDTKQVRMVAGKRERCIVLDWSVVEQIHYDLKENKGILPY